MVQTVTVNPKDWKDSDYNTTAWQKDHKDYSLRMIDGNYVISYISNGAEKVETKQVKKPVTKKKKSSKKKK